jgi:hypothetical protein
MFLMTGSANTAAMIATAVTVATAQTEFIVTVTAEINAVGVAMIATAVTVATAQPETTKSRGIARHPSGGLWSPLIATM